MQTLPPANPSHSQSKPTRAGSFGISEMFHQRNIPSWVLQPLDATQPSPIFVSNVAASPESHGGDNIRTDTVLGIACPVTVVVDDCVEEHAKLAEILPAIAGIRREKDDSAPPDRDIDDSRAIVNLGRSLHQATEH